MRESKTCLSEFIESPRNLFEFSKKFSPHRIVLIVPSEFEKKFE